MDCFLPLGHVVCFGSVTLPPSRPFLSWPRGAYRGALVRSVTKCSALTAFPQDKLRGGLGRNAMNCCKPVRKYELHVDKYSQKQKDVPSRVGRVHCTHSRGGRAPCATPIISPQLSHLDTAGVFSQRRQPRSVGNTL